MTEPFLMHKAHGAPLRASNKSRHNTRSLHNQQRNQLGISNATSNYDDQTLRVCRRFYVALILSLLVQVLFSIFCTLIFLFLQLFFFLKLILLVNKEGKWKEDIESFLVDIL